MTISGEVKIGDRVSYEDMANPRRVGTVTQGGLSRQDENWLVVWDDDDEWWSDLRQHGWNRVDA